MQKVPSLMALTMGEPAGVAGEITLQAWLARNDSALPPFFAIDDPDHLSALAKRLSWNVPISIIEDPEEARSLFADSLPVLAQPLAEKVTPGQANPSNAPAVVASIEMAVKLALEGQIGAVVTNPINKAALYDCGFRHPGHTEFLASLTQTGHAPVMMLASQELRVVPVTIHLALKEAVRTLTRAQIVHCGKITIQSLKKDFSISEPRLAVCGLNPHAGEGGALGREEIEVIEPAVLELRAKGYKVSSPSAADSLFHAEARRGYDAVLCMYHDQALIPIKTLVFDKAVNTTLGLPIVRTSPDHGTAFDIAGRGIASPTSLIAAIAQAATMAENRARSASRQ